MGLFSEIASITSLLALELPAWELPNTWTTFAIVLVVLIVAIWAVTRLNAHTTEEIDSAEIDRQMLTAVSELRSQGELSQEEFRSIKSRLVGRIKDAELQPTNADSTDQMSIDDSEENKLASESCSEVESTEQDSED